MGFYAVDYYLEHCKLSGNEKLAMIVLAHHADDSNGTCFPGVERIAERLNISKRGAQNVLSKLRENGHIDIDYNAGVNTGTGKTNLYRLIAYANHKQGVHAASSLGNTEGVNNRAQGVNAGTQGVNGASSKQSEEYTEDHTGRDPRVREAAGNGVYSPSSLDSVQTEYMPGLPDPRQSRRNGQRAEVGERFAEAQRLGLTAVQYRELVDALLLGFGKKALVDAGNDRALYFAQEVTLRLMRMSEAYRTPDGIQSIFQSWYANDWRGKKGEKPTSEQFEEHASAMADGAIGKPAQFAETKPTMTAKQWCLKEYGTDTPTVALGIPESQWRAKYEQAIRVH